MVHNKKMSRSGSCFYHLWSKGCGNGLPEVLEINGNSELRILTSNSLYANQV
jgi:hypothetical protein